MIKAELSDFKIDRGYRYIINKGFIRGWDGSGRLGNYGVSGGMDYQYLVKNVLKNCTCNITSQDLSTLVGLLTLVHRKDFVYLNLYIGSDEYISHSKPYFPVICGELFPISIVDVYNPFVIYSYIFKLYIIEHDIKISMADIKTKDFGIYDIENKEIISIECIASGINDAKPFGTERYEQHLNIYYGSWIWFFSLIFKLITIKESSQPKLIEIMDGYYIDFSTVHLDALGL